MPSIVLLRGACICLTIVAAAPLTPVYAQQADSQGSGDKVSEIIVTAQKREQNMQSVGTSITAFDTNAMERLGLHDVTDVVGQVPGLQFNQFGSTVTVYNLRGISQNDFSDHEEAPVAVYSDDAYVASTGALAGTLFDLQRVEVLRGPQGTLFGRNATGGLIQYISNKPTDDPQGYLVLTGGSYGEIDSEGALGGPLADKLDGRISFSTARHAGYIHNLVGPDVNDQEQYAGRVQLLYKPTDNLDLLLKLHGLTNNHETQGNYSWDAAYPDATGRGVFTPGQPDFNGYTKNNSDPYVQSEDRPGIFNRTVWGATGTANLRTDAFTLTAVSDYLKVQKRYGEDSDISPLPVFNYDVFYHYEQFSQELRANGDLIGGRFRWVGGAYYLNYRTTADAITFFNPDYNDFCFGGAPGAGCSPGQGLGDAHYILRTSSPAAFTQVEYDIAPKWTLLAGVRYTYDNKRFDYTFDSRTSPYPDLQQYLHYAPSTSPAAARNWNIFTGKVEADFKPTDSTLLYVSVNRGAKGGGWSATSAAPVNPDLLPFDQERLTSYETGIKSTFWEGRARLNADFFYYDYRNYQGFFLNVATQVVENVNARDKGGELELALAPARGLTVQLGLSHLETRVPFVPTPSGVIVPTQMPQAPRWSFNAVARYEWPFIGGQFSVEADGKYSTYQYLELVNSPVDYQPGYLVANSRVGWTSSDGRWEAYGFVKNMTDKQYRIYNLDVASLIGSNQSVYAPPRTYGATVRFHFGK